MEEFPIGAGCEDPCPDCNGSMFLKLGPFGRFWGCGRYPDCSGTRQFQDEPQPGPEESIDEPEDEQERQRRFEEQEFALQMLALGVLLGNKQLRKDCAPEDHFHDLKTLIAVRGLNAPTDYDYLSNVLLELGVIWNVKMGSPLDAVFSKLRMNVEFWNSLNAVNEALEKIEFGRTQVHIDQYYDALKDAVDRRCNNDSEPT